MPASSSPQNSPKWLLLLTLIMLGFSAGLPLLLIFSTLSLWLTEAGIERKMVTMFSWAALGYSFKFVWSPLLDSLPLPFFTRRLGKRRAWLLLAQCGVITAVCVIAITDPATSGSVHQLSIMAFAAVVLGFSSATQDIAIDAYRIEIAPHDSAMQSALSAAYTAGYRLGLFVAGAGSLLLAAKFGSSGEHYVYTAWRDTYFIMAGFMGLGILTTLLMRESPPTAPTITQTSHEHSRLLGIFVIGVASFVGTFYASGSVFSISASPLIAFLWESVRLILSVCAAIITALLCVKTGFVQRDTLIQTWCLPITEFFQRYGKKSLILLTLIGFYRVSDIVSGVISNVFYADLGFSKEEIAWAVKTFGVIMSIMGGFFGGFLAHKWSLMRMMMLGAIAAALTNLLFVALAWRGHNVSLMYLAVGLDNFAAGFAGTAFIAFLSALTNIRFTAVQYALFSSLMTLFPKVLGGYSGGIVDHIGYAGFFGFTALLGLPIVFLVWRARTILPSNH